MLNKILLPTISFVLTFILNYLFHQDLLISFLNSCSLSLSIYIFQNYLNEKKIMFNIFLTISLSLIPLFHYQPNNYLISFLPLLSLGFFYIQFFIHPTKKLFNLIILIWVLFLFFAIAYSSEIIKFPFNIQNSQLIFNSPEINYNIGRHQQDALLFPFKIRQIIYSNLIFIYAILSNFFNFFNLKNLLDILFLVNLYPLFLGIFDSLSQKVEFRILLITAILIAICSIGIDRSTDKFQSLYVLGPTLIYLIILGMKSINKKIYLALWIISFFILISPKI